MSRGAHVSQRSVNKHNDIALWFEQNISRAQVVDPQQFFKLALAFMKAQMVLNAHIVEDLQALEGIAPTSPLYLPTGLKVRPSRDEG
jgi:hypothetical protein